MTALEPADDIARDLAGAYGTPLYLYRLDEIRRAYDALRAALPVGVKLYYSLKANPHPAVVAELLRCGATAEVSSLGELDTALTAGADPTQILYTGPGKAPAEAARALRSNVRAFSVESFGQLRMLTEQTRKEALGIRCLLRVNTGAADGGGLRMNGASQFGIDLEELRSGVRDAIDDSVSMDGLHFFPASSVVDPPTLLRSIERSIAVAAELQDRVGTPFTEIDLGGGFAAPFATAGGLIDYSGLREQLTSLLDGYLPDWRRGAPTVSFESGRYLVGAAGSLVCRVLDVKEVGGRHYAVLDAGINHLGGLSGLGRLLPLQAQLLSLSDHDGDDREESVTFVGPLCTPMDTLSRNVRMPVPRIGDLLRVPNVGAYGLSASLVGFLSRALPWEAVVDGGELESLTRTELIRSAEVAGDYLPSDRRARSMASQNDSAQ
ncbi:alanine racemase [Nocardia asiatica]|uniref:alanine racemase n=1 Tax=Nocardia asiatica TaxID=209252 RepID=UPI003EE2BBCC